MLKNAWKIFSRIVFIIGLFLLLVAAVELLRVYVILKDVHEGVALGFLFCLGVVIVSLVIYFLAQWFSFPRVLTPPALPEDYSKASHRELKLYAQYLIKYLRRLAVNSNLMTSSVDRADEHIALLQDTLRSHPLRDDLIRDIRLAEDNGVIPLLEQLDELASKEVRRSVRDVMLGVSLSPYHSLDVFVVLYRNGTMINRIARIYASRPLHREQWLVLRDTFRVVAAVNILNLSKTLFDKLFAQLPFIGRAIDEIGQGIGAGLLTSATGRAAMERCAAFRGWNRASAVDSLSRHAAGFFVDVKDLFTKDVLPSLKPRILATAPKEVSEKPDFWNGLNDGITRAVDGSAKAVGDYLIKPAVAGTIGVARITTRGGYHTIRGTGRGIMRIFSIFNWSKSETVEKNE